MPGSPTSRPLSTGRRDRRRTARLGVQRTGIPLGRELQRAETQHLAAAALVARLAVADAGDRVRASAAERIGVAPAAFRREHAPRAHPRSTHRPHRATGRRPSAPGSASRPRAREGKFLPQPGADREHPGVRVGGVDRGARRQRDPAPLGGAVGPERILRRERKVLRVDAAASRKSA